MRRIKMIVVVFGLLSLLLASAAPAMAQSTPPWATNDAWTPPDPGYTSNYPSDYYDQGYLPGYYDNAYQQFQDNCIGVTSGDQCIGVGPDLSDYLDNYYGGPAYWDPYYQDPNNWDPYWAPYNQG